MKRWRRRTQLSQLHPIWIIVAMLPAQWCTTGSKLKRISYNDDVDKELLNLVPVAVWFHWHKWSPSSSSLLSSSCSTTQTHTYTHDIRMIQNCSLHRPRVRPVTHDRPPQEPINCTTHHPTPHRPPQVSYLQQPVHQVHQPRILKYQSITAQTFTSISCRMKNEKEEGGWGAPAEHCQRGGCDNIPRQKTLPRGRTWVIVVVRQNLLVDIVSTWHVGDIWVESSSKSNLPPKSLPRGDSHRIHHPHHQPWAAATAQPQAPATSTTHHDHDIIFYLRYSSTTVPLNWPHSDLYEWWHSENQYRIVIISILKIELVLLNSLDFIIVILHYRGRSSP